MPDSRALRDTNADVRKMALNCELSRHISDSSADNSKGPCDQTVAVAVALERRQKRPHRSRTSGSIRFAQDRASLTERLQQSGLLHRVVAVDQGCRQL